MDAKLARFWNGCRSQIVEFHRMLSGNFDYSLDQFFGLDFLLAVGGIRFSSKRVKLRYCWNVYRWLIQLPVLLIVWNTFLSIRESEKLEVILSCTQASVCVLVIQTRAYLVLWHYDSLMKVRTYLSQRYFGRGLELAWNVRSESYYRSRKTVILVVTVEVIYVSGFFAIDVANHHVTKFPGFGIWDNPALLNLAKTVFRFMLFGVAFKALCITLLSPMILNGLNTEATVVALMFSNAFKSTDEQAIAGNSGQQTIDLRYWKRLQDEFSECIGIHVEFLAALDRIRPLLNATFLVIYYSTALSFASGVIYATQVKSITLFAFQTLFYCLWVAIESKIVTKMVDELADVCESISTEVFDLDWPMKLQSYDRFPVQYRSIRATMVTLMAVAQQPLRLNCFGLFEFNQEQFYELVNMTYSLYTFFRDFV